MGDHVALVLPGGSAGPNSAPLLIPSLAAEQLGIRVEVVRYPEFRPESLDREAARAFDAVVFDRVRQLVDSCGAEKVTFIAKSRGTVVLSTMPPLDDVACEAIWVTPLFGLDYVAVGFVEKGWRSLVVAGGADRYHDPVAHEQCKCALARARSHLLSRELITYWSLTATRPRRSPGSLTWPKLRCGFLTIELPDRRLWPRMTTVAGF